MEKEQQDTLQVVAGACTVLRAVLILFLRRKRQQYLPREPRQDVEHHSPQHNPLNGSDSQPGYGITDIDDEDIEPFPSARTSYSPPHSPLPSPVPTPVTARGSSSTTASASTCTKRTRKRKPEDEEFRALGQQINQMTEAINKLCPGSDINRIWEEILKVEGLDEDEAMKCVEFLSSNKAKATFFFSIPIHKRRQWLDRKVLNL